MDIPLTQGIKRIIIVGGGTAGWLAAARLAYDHCASDAQGIHVTLVESPDVKTLGVGEGSWPTLRVTLKELGIAEHDFIAACDVTLKQGSKFVRWHQDTPSDSYYHPFAPPNVDANIDAGAAWQQLRPNQPYAFAVNAQASLAELGLAPKQAAMPDYAAYSNYGYHLNAGKFADFMRNYCVQRLGVDHQRWHIDCIEQNASGDITALVGRDAQRLEGDFFIDCSGTARVLIGLFDTDCVDLSSQLFNDRAIAAQVPYMEPSQHIATVTTATAQADGWVWDIGLTNRRGVGFVYSSRFTDEDQACERLERYLQSTGVTAPDLASFRRLRFTPGYLTQPWQKNCVAIGMSAGFVEPLEASAIAMIEVCTKGLSNDLPEVAGLLPTLAKRFNRRFTRRWASVADFLKLHYVLSEREEPYWRAHREPHTASPALHELLELWYYHSPNAGDFDYVHELFGPASYEYVMYGMGHKPARITEPSLQTQRCYRVGADALSLVDDTVRRGIRGLPKHRVLMDTLAQQYTSRSIRDTV